MDYGLWADNVAYDMRDYYEANRPLRWWERRNPPDSWGCIADDLMLGLLDIALRAKAERDSDATRRAEPFKAARVLKHSQARVQSASPNPGRGTDQ